MRFSCKSKINFQTMVFGVFSILWMLNLAVGVSLQAGEIVIDASRAKRAISPSIYGRNNSLSDNPEKPLSCEQWQFLKDAGVRMFRECGGNNATKYNWKLKISSHPNWYNNVYPHDWDYLAESLQKNMPNAKAVFALQLLGWSAGNDKSNFDAAAFNTNRWSSAVNSNWAGGGGRNKKEGNPELYLVPWSASDTAGILKHWFGPKGLGLNKENFVYWDMDNEPEVWFTTHDDVMKTQISADSFIKRYVEVAKKARKNMPEIKLMGPVMCNEWQWYNWNNNKIKTPDGSFTWLEYFIRRIAEEEKKTKIRLLDVFDLHWYPGETKAEDILQLHRVWFDTNYDYPGANGIKRLGPSDWNDGNKKEYLFLRCKTWLEKYLGKNHGVTLGVSEMEIKSDDPNLTALWYASTLGVFMGEGVEIFSPWEWKPGMWEVLHLFSRYNREISVFSSSTLEPAVSVYPTISSNGKSMTIVLVNRDKIEKNNISVDLKNFTISNGKYKTLRLDGLPGEETFKSHTENALKNGNVQITDSKLSISLPAYSITSVLVDP